MFIIFDIFMRKQLTRGNANRLLAKEKKTVNRTDKFGIQNENLKTTSRQWIQSETKKQRKAHF